MGSYKFPTNPFIYANPLICLDVKLTGLVLSLTVPSVFVREPEVEFLNPIPLILDLPRTADLDT